MAFTLVQAGTALQMLDTSGNVTAVSLPTGVTLDSSLRPRFAVFGQYVVVTNSVSRPITVDQYGVARVLTPTPPSTRITLSGNGSSSLSGIYRVAQTFRIEDDDGNVIAESDYGPVSDPGTVVTQFLKASNIDLSSDTITKSKLYRTTTSGSVLFPWIDVDGNVQTTAQDDLPDAALSTIEAPVLGTAPDLMLIAEWRGRLWGVSRVTKDDLQWTESGLMYAWPADNSVPIPRIGSDARGVTALAARRDALGVGRRDVLHQMTGTSNSDFRLVKLSENVGIDSQESVVIWKDTAFWLWKDGIYQWNNEGIKNVSDGKVGAWFNTSSYFNPAVFAQTFARMNPNTGRYELFLAAAGGTTINRWIEYDPSTGKFWGPHKTDAFTPTAALVLSDADDVLVPVIGSSSGYLFQPQATRTDGASTAITIDVDTKYHDANTPTITKRFGFLTIVGKVQSSGTLTITPKVGYLNASAGTPISYDMTQGRQKLRRLGVGQLAQLNLAHATAGEDVELYGYEIDDINELGDRG